ncbi:MAG: hypothetical protein AAGA30_07010 [Planctomycetota bacterium]
MPQFPHFQKRIDKVEPDPNIDHDEQMIDLMGEASAAEKREPIKYKTVETKGPVSRVRLSGEKKSKSTTKKNPFKDANLLEDTDSLIQFRDNFGKPVALTVVAVAIVFGIYWFSQPSSTESENAEAISQLIQKVETLSADKPSSQKERKQHFQQQIELADQLLEFEDDPSALERGAELKLQTLTEWDAIQLQTGNSNNEIRETLEETSRQYINSRFQTVTSYAKVGLTLIRVHKYLDNPDITFFPEILDQFKLVTTFAKKDVVSAKNLMRVAEAFESRELDEEASQLFQAINLSFSASPNDQIASIGLDARLRVSDASNLFEDLKSLIKPDQPLPIADIRKMIGENTKEGSVTISAIESTLEFAEMLVTKNMIPATRTILGDLSRPIFSLSPGLEKDTIKKRFDDFQRRVTLIGQEFKYNGLYSVNGRPIKRTNLERQMKFVVFWSPENKASIELINSLSDAFAEFAKREIQVVAISSVVKGETAAVEQMANSQRGIEFLTLIQGDTASREFTSRFPLPKLPFWVLLTNNDRIQGYNVAPRFLKIAAQ